MKRKMEQKDLTDQQKLYVKQRATDICFTILTKGDTFYRYGNDFHFWWTGPRFNNPRVATQKRGLVEFHDPEDIWLALDCSGYLYFSERPLWKVIAEAVQDIAYKHCQELPHDPKVDLEIAQTRGKRQKRITAYNCIWERLHDKHRYDKMKGN